MAAGHVEATSGRRLSMCSGQRHPWLWALSLGIFFILNLTSVGHSASIGASVRPSVLPPVSPSLRQSVSPSVSSTVENAADTSDTYGVITTSGYERDAREEMLDQNYIVEVPMEAVPVQMVAQRIQEADTYHDVLSIFYGDRLTNDIIDDILATQWHGRPSSKARPRPRIGGLSDTMSFSPHETTFQGRRSHLNSSHMCVGYMAIGPSYVPRRIAGRTRVKNRTDSKRRVRRHKKKRGRRKGRGRNRKRKGKKGTRKRKRNKKRKGPKRKRKRKGRRRSKALSKALVHAKEMLTETQCNAPKPRLVCMRDVSSVANKEYFPGCTVVHQCSPSVGCCNASSECSPMNTSIITRHFFVMEYKTADYRGTMEQAETFTFVNHTACGCRLVNQPPKCKKCPFPFEIRRNEKAACHCECFSDDLNCLRIKKGHKPLSESELACLKANLCERPKCSHGKFDESSIKSGYCPAPSVRSAGAPKRGSHSRYRVATDARLSPRRRRG